MRKSPPPFIPNYDLNYRMVAHFVSHVIEKHRHME